jgi:hypothetical protein
MMQESDEKKMGTKPKRHQLIKDRWVLRQLFKRGRSYAVRVRDKVTGRVRYKTLFTENRREAGERALAWVEELVKTVGAVTREVSVEKAWAEWLATKVDARPSTLKRYESVGRVAPGSESGPISGC